MAGTDKGRAPLLGQTILILVEPQMGENIGAAARAMYNFGLTELRLVAPRDGWPNKKAVAMAAGADRVISAVQVFATVPAAIADLKYVAATTARPRHMVKTVLEPAVAIPRILAHEQTGAKCGILFGGERAGLDNEDVAAAHEIIQIPVNPAFASLNLGQAVLLVAYELFRARHGANEHKVIGALPPLDYLGSELATGEEVQGLIDHLNVELEQAGYFYPPEKKEVMARTIRNIIQRAMLSQQETQIMRGVIKTLSHGRPPRK